MYYFVSDTHLGGGSPSDARATEQRFVEWLRSISADVDGLFLCGDIFDFWFEYQYVIPKGFVRVLSEIAALTDRGVKVVFMAGNHDMWLGNYLSAECGVEIYTAPKVFNIAGRRVHVAHGDNLNVTGDVKLSLLNKIFRSAAIRSIFSTLLHPDLALRFGLWWSNKSRKKHARHEGHNTIDGEGIRPLIEYAKRHEAGEHNDIYIYGHLHQVFRYEGEGFEVLFMNDWSEEPHYITIDNDGVAQINRV